MCRQACEGGGEWEGAMELLDEMREAGLKPDLFSYNTAIEACQAVSQRPNARGARTSP
jgi:pentatricopeptide repeat protein